MTLRCFVCERMLDDACWFVSFNHRLDHGLGLAALEGFEWLTKSCSHLGALNVGYLSQRGALRLLRRRYWVHLRQLQIMLACCIADCLLVFTFLHLLRTFIFVLFRILIPLPFLKHRWLWSWLFNILDLLHLSIATFSHLFYDIQLFLNSFKKFISFLLNLCARKLVLEWVIFLVFLSPGHQRLEQSFLVSFLCNQIYILCYLQSFSLHIIVFSLNMLVAINPQFKCSLALLNLHALTLVGFRLVWIFHFSSWSFFIIKFVAFTQAFCLLLIHHLSCLEYLLVYRLCLLTIGFVVYLCGLGILLLGFKLWLFLLRILFILSQHNVLHGSEGLLEIVVCTWRFPRLDSVLDMLTTNISLILWILLLCRHEELSVLAITLELSESIHILLFSPNFFDFFIWDFGHFEDFLEQFVFTHVFLVGKIC